MPKKIIWFVFLLCLLVGGWWWITFDGLQHFDYYILHKGIAPHYCKPKPCDDYEEGVVEVRFNADLNFEDKRTFLQKMNLQLTQASSVKTDQTFIVDVIVPIGQELKWANTLNLHTEVSSAYPINRGHNNNIRQ